MNIVFGATGSVASVKYWSLFKALKSIGNVKGVLTKKGEFFARKGLEVKYKELASFAEDNTQNLLTEDNEWDWNEIGDPIPHIDLKDWGDILVIAPLSANTLTKMSIGLCDNLLTSLFYAWDPKKSVVVAPAMNTDMWNNPLTRKHIKELSERQTCGREPTDYETANDPNRGFYNFKHTPYQSLENGLFGYYVITKKFGVIEPVSKTLACGVKGKGAMAPVDDIVNTVKSYGE